MITENHLRRATHFVCCCLLSPITIVVSVVILLCFPCYVIMTWMLEEKPFKKSVKIEWEYCNFMLKETLTLGKGRV